MPEPGRKHPIPKRSVVTNDTEIQNSVTTVIKTLSTENVDNSVHNL